MSVVGIGPGGEEHLSSKARNALLEADLIVGYTAYIRLIEPLITDQELYASGMRKELDRARKAVAEALKGRRVCLISSGDPGIYGMAGPLLQLLTQEDFKRIELAIIPGITAASTAASALGAPLMHDFAVISLSDLLTDPKLIEQRIEYAARGDFVIVFYNPQSSRRRILLGRAREILLKYKSPDTVVGFVRHAGRSNEYVQITTLKDLPIGSVDAIDKIDMNTTVIVGNTETYRLGRFMITPRGYKISGQFFVPEN